MAGEPSHFELGVPDARRATSFYGQLFGWAFTSTTGDDAWIETPGVRGAYTATTTRRTSRCTSPSMTSRLL